MICQLIDCRKLIFILVNRFLVIYVNAVCHMITGVLYGNVVNYVIDGALYGNVVYYVIDSALCGNVFNCEIDSVLCGNVVCYVTDGIRCSVVHYLHFRFTRFLDVLSFYTTFFSRLHV